MEMKNIGSITVGIIVSIILVVAVATPIITDISKDIASIENNKESNYILSGSETDWKINMVPGENGTYTYEINGKTINAKDGVLLWSPSIMLASSDTDKSLGIWDKEHGGKLIKAKTANLEKIGDEVIYSLEGTEVSRITVTDPIFIASDNGDYTIITPTENNTVFVNETSKCAAFKAQTHFGDTYTTGIFEFGNAPTTITKYTKSATPVSSQEAFTINSAIIEGNIAYEIKGATAEAGVNLQMFVPIEYKIITDSDTTAKSIIGIIPILLVIGILLGITGSIVYKRMN